MLQDFKIVKENVPTAFIGDDGNLQFHSEDERFFLKNDEGETLSRQYYCMVSLGDDHFAVCDIKSNIKLPFNYNYYDIIKGDYELASIATPKMKWGIMRLTRDNEGKIIPGAETMIIPYIYDRISINNLKTATVYSRDKLTYLDIDQNRESYGQQLVPCVLEHAVEFCVGIEGFAECCVDNVVGYLPRDCKIKDSIKGNELLTRDEALAISKFLEGETDYYLDSNTIMAYFDLTGIVLNREEGQQRIRNKETKN